MSTRPDPLLVLGILTRLLSQVPDKVRSRIYSVVSTVFLVATLVVAVFPYAEVFGVEVPARWVAIFTFIVSLQAKLARVHVTPAYAFGGETYLDPAERARYAEDSYPEGPCCH